MPVFTSVGIKLLKWNDESLSMNVGMVMLILVPFVYLAVEYNLLLIID